jgi:hypothetical protein
VDAAARVMCANADAARAMGPTVCGETIQPLRPLATNTQSCYSDAIVAARMKMPVCQ